MARLDSTADPSDAAEPQHVQEQHGPLNPGELIQGGLLHEVGGTGPEAVAGGVALWLAALDDLGGLGGQNPAPHGTEQDLRTTLLWVTSRAQVRDYGLPFGPGLQDWGWNPAHLLLVVGQKPQEALWAAEEGLRAGTLKGVLLETSGMDLTASRRLSLAATHGATPCLAVRTGTAAESALATAHSRWHLSPAPSPQQTETSLNRQTVSRPQLTLTLQRHRRWREGTRFVLEGHYATHRLDPLAALADRPLAAGPAARPPAYRAAST